MANRFDSVIYSPYGAYELKSKYQKYFMMSTGIVTGFFLLITGVYLIIANLDDGAIDLTGRVIKTVADLGPPPSVAHTPPQVQIQKPDIALPKIGIPKPVADEELLDEDVVLATKDELAEIVAPDITAEGEGIVIDIDDDPLPGDFIPVEIQPELIHKEKPAYPRLARQAQLEGTVHLRVLVKKDGSVGDAIIQKTSGITSLDDAALRAVYGCKFKPAIQNGRPVKVWVSFPYEFILYDKRK
ncbi:MAG: energy transducer TonB [candidate division Zixibacteria bacterium]|nr:energy transducer TonB [candidate division Zixibacteria bacterium]